VEQGRGTASKLSAEEQRSSYPELLDSVVRRLVHVPEASGGSRAQDSRIHSAEVLVTLLILPTNLNPATLSLGL
jgi:hypothetical protein